MSQRDQCADFMCKYSASKFSISNLFIELITASSCTGLQATQAVYSNGFSQVCFVITEIQKSKTE